MREINLVAQDSTSWGKDLRRAGRASPSWSARSTTSTGLDWIRLLYLYPTRRRPTS